MRVGVRNITVSVPQAEPSIGDDLFIAEPRMWRDLLTVAEAPAAETPFLHGEVLIEGRSLGAMFIREGAERLLTTHR